MRERPIIFNVEMVRAVLEGRKTQTRQIMKVQPEVIPKEDEFGEPGFWIPFSAGKTMVRNEDMRIACPFGLKGDRLWVRETWQCTSFETNEYGHVEGVDYMRQISVIKPNSPAWGVSYKANGFDTDDAEERGFPWRPSIHMPRWASRITLEITGVRVERLQQISEADAKAEGLAEITKDGSLFKFGIPDRDGYPGTDDNGWPWTEWERNPVDAYCKLWASIYGADSWQANPWVWVIEFKRVANHTIGSSISSTSSEP